MRQLVIAAALLAAAAFSAPAGAEPKVVGGGTSEICAAAVLDARSDAHTGVADCTDALKYQPMSMVDRIATTINRGTLRSRAGDLTGALADFSDAISMDAANAGAYLNRSATLLGLKRYGEAKADADMAIRLHAMPTEVA